MVVQHNLAGMNSNRQMNIDVGFQTKSMEKLASGYRINRAADDAAGLSISEKMRREIRGLTQGTNNCQDGISWCQIADGALNEIDDMLARVKEIAVKSANETLMDKDREYLDDEVQRLSKEIDRIHASTKFNEIAVFDGGYGPDAGLSNQSLVIKGQSGNTITIEMPYYKEGTGKIPRTTASVGVGADSTDYTGTDVGTFVQNAAGFAASKIMSNFRGLIGAASSDNINIGLELGNIDGKNGTLAYASLAMSWDSEWTIMSYTMKIDTSDYPIEDFASMSSDKKADLAATIAHEMTHLIMYDTLTNGMLNSLPSWFKEGVAQTSSGDNGWVSNHLNSSSSDADIKNYMSKLGSMPYGAGYLASMYVGYLASGSAGVDSGNIKNGLDTFMTKLATGKTFDEAFAELTPYSSYADFSAGFTSGDTKSLSFVKALLNARGANGAGSLLGNLGDSESTIFGSASSGSSSNYVVKTDFESYANYFHFGSTTYSSLPAAPSSAGGSKVPAADLYIQAGANASEFDELVLHRFAVSVDKITGSAGFDVKTAVNARNTIETVNVAGDNVSKIRSYYGALQQR